MGEIADHHVDRYADGAWGQPHRARQRISNIIEANLPEGMTIRNYGGAIRPTVSFGLNIPSPVPREGEPLPPSAILAPQYQAHLQRISSNLSASQAKTWDRCKRLWWLERIAKLPQKDAMHFKVGHALHAVAERYLRREVKAWADLFPEGWDKGLDDDGKEYVPFAAKQAIELGLWQAVEGILVEEPIALLVGQEFRDERGMPLLARAEDFIDEQGVRRIARLTTLLDGSPLPAGYDRLRPLVGFVDLAALNKPVPRISDHKSAKSRRYTLTPEKLERDRQIRVYCCWIFAQRKDVTVCEAEHIVFLKQLEAPEPSFSTLTDVTLAAARQCWDEIIQVAEDMKLVSDLVPVEIDKANPFNRADRWKAVQGAVDEGPVKAKESCGAYGGCVFKDVCHGRATAAEVVRRLDSPSMMDLVRKVTAPTPPVAFGLNHRSLTTTSPTKDMPMAFGAQTSPSFPIGSDCYLLDQVNKNVQFRARIMGHPKPGEAKIALWPHPDREPYWAALPPVYLIDMLISELFATPSPMAQVKGYHQELVEANMGAGAEWKDMQGTINTVVLPPAPPHASPLTGHSGPAAPPTAADGFSDAKVSRPPHVPFGGTPLGGTPAPAPLIHSPGIAVTMGTPPPPAASKAQALANQMQTAVAAEAANQVPQPNFEPKIGDVVEFLPAPTHKFWAGFAGRHATVTDVSLGQDQLMVSVTVEGVEYPDLQSGRFKLVSRAPAKPAAAAATPTQSATAPTGTPVTQQTVPGVSLLPPTLEAALALVGKSVVFQATHQAMGFNAVVEAVDAEGVTILKVKYPWASVARLSQLTPTDIPGGKAPKLSAAEKKAAKAQEEKNAQHADRMNALNQAHQLVSAMVKGEGKVTKKAVEALLPLLEAAVVWQGELTATATGGAPAPSPSPATVEIAAALQAARDNLDLAAQRLGLA